MRTLPRDVQDLMLAPVALQVEDRLVELGALSLAELPERLALDSDLPGWDPDHRAGQVMASVTRGLELHGWQTSWDERGLRLRHGIYTLVLGVPAAVAHYVSGTLDES